MLASNAVSELNNFSTHLGLQVTCEYVVDQDLAQTRCFLNLSPKSHESSEAPCRFEAVGQNKKEAKRNASQNALTHLMDRHSSREVALQSAEEAVLSALSAEKLRKDPVMRCYFYMACRLSNGWIPLNLVLATKVMKSWAKKRGCDNKRSLRDLRSQVVDELMSGMSDRLHVSDDGLLVLPSESIPFPDDIDGQTYGTATEKDNCDVVLLPVDQSISPFTVQLTSESGLLNNVMEGLGASLQHLCLFPAVRGTSLFVPSLEQVDRNLAVEVSNDGIFSEIPVDKIPKPCQIKSPSLWYNDNSHAVENVRASWFCGRPIHGDALFTLTRPSGSSTGGYLMMTWRDYSLRSFWTSVWSLSPEKQFTNSLSVPILGRLPTSYDAASEWQGRLPLHLLDTYLQMTGRGLCLAERTTACGMQEARLSVAKTELIVTEVGENADIVKQQAALQMICLLQQMDKVLWDCRKDNPTEESHTDVNVDIINCGHKHGPMVLRGSKVKVQYRLLVWSETLGDWFLMESSDGFIFQVSTASALDQAVCGLHLGGDSRTLFTGAIARIEHDCEEEASGFHQFRLFVKVLTVVGYQNDVKLFDPPLSKQRYAAVAELLRECNCRSVVDMGCGEGRFLEALICTGGKHFSCLHGVDISSSALQRAASRISQLEKPPELCVTLSLGNTLDGSLNTWGQGIDAVVMIEVVEHLDPAPLGQVGSAVLGGIGPRVFIATTPNWEYNRVLYHIGGAPVTGVLGRDGTPLRCSDHRFEWTRGEFQSWAQGLAAQFGYDVEFAGVGKMLMEDVACKELSLEGYDFGYPTQAAVFTKNVHRVAAFPELWSAKGLSSQLQTVWTSGSMPDE